MRNAYALAVAMLLGASVPSEALYASYPNYDQSTQIFMQKTLESIPLGQELRRFLADGATVALYSIEGVDRLQGMQDLPMTAMIEDAAIRSMVLGGLKVEERDLHSIDAGWLERSRENLLVQTRAPVPQPALEAPKSSASSIFKAPEPQSSTVVINLAQAPAPVLPQLAPIDTSRVAATTVAWKGADYLVTFRVQEAGILFREDSSTISNDFEIREGIVRIHVRAVQAATGRIVYANDLTGRVSDVIDEHLRHSLNNIRPGFFGFTYPFQKEQDAHFSKLQPVLRGETNWWAAYQMGFMPKAAQLKWTRNNAGGIEGPKGVSSKATAGTQVLLGYGMERDWNAAVEFSSFKTSGADLSGDIESSDIVLGGDFTVVQGCYQKMIFPWVFGEAGISAMNVSYTDIKKTGGPKTDDWALGYHLGGGLDADVPGLVRAMGFGASPWMRSVFLQGGWAMNSELGSVQSSSEVFLRVGIRSFKLLLLK